MGRLINGGLGRTAIAGWAILPAAPAPAAAAQDAQLWLVQGADSPVVGRLMAQGEAQVRLSDAAGGLRRHQYRFNLGVRATDQLRLSLGGQASHQLREGRDDRIELRALGQADWARGLRGGRLASRTRIGARFVKDVDDTGWRLRQRLTFDRPLRQSGPSLVVNAEGFFGLIATDGGWSADSRGRGRFSGWAYRYRGACGSSRATRTSGPPSAAAPTGSTISPLW
jgi:hypothetical protein